MDSSVMDIDRYTNAELRALDFAKQVGLANDLLGETGRLASVECLAVDVLADAQMKAVQDPSSENKAAVIDARRKLRKVSIAQRARSKQANILQSLIRGVPQL